jgi:hypothetical protein
MLSMMVVTKHVKISDITHDIRDEVKSREVNVEYCNTSDMVAYVLTKRLQHEAHAC